MYKSYNELGSDIKRNTDIFDVVEVKNLEHKNHLINTNRFLCIEYYADWCGPCKQTASTYGILANNYNKNGEILLVKYNVDKIPKNDPDRNNIRGIPSFLFYFEGQKLDEVVVGADLDRVEQITKRYYDMDNSTTSGPSIYNKNSIRNNKTNIPNSEPGNPYMSYGNYKSNF